MFSNPLPYLGLASTFLQEEANDAAAQGSFNKMLLAAQNRARLRNLQLAEMISNLQVSYGKAQIQSFSGSAWAVQKQLQEQAQIDLDQDYKLLRNQAQTLDKVGQANRNRNLLNSVLPFL